MNGMVSMVNQIEKASATMAYACIVKNQAG